MVNKFSHLLFVSTLSVASVTFAYNPNDPIGWAQTTNFPATVRQNSGIYSATFSFANQTGNLVPYFGMLLNASPVAAFSIGANTCNQPLANLTGTCEVQVNFDSSKASAGTATVQANPNYAIFNVLVPQPGDSIIVTSGSTPPPPTPPTPPPGSNYLMWSLPSTVISYPVYAYQGGVQVNYIPSSSVQAFLGTYPAGVENKTFTLYYLASGSTYQSCNVVFTSTGALDASTTCSGAVINPPKAPSSNVYTIALGATAFPTTTGTPSPAPAIPLYSDRGIVFKNDTGYAAIRVQGNCADLAACQNNAFDQIIQRGGSASLPVGNAALTSAAFYVTGYCNAASYSTLNCPSDFSGSNWVSTGGYNGTNGSHPYATKVEATFLVMTNSSTPSGASNVDVSAVDGFNMAVQLYPGTTTGSGPTVTPGAYCTYTVPPEGSNILGAGFYDTSVPLAKIFASAATITNLNTLCTSSSQLPPGNGGTAWALSVNNFTGCMSPCTYAQKNDPSQADMYCCTGAYNTPETCDATSGTEVAANTSTYVDNVYKNFKNVYPYAYGDAGSDYACEADKSYVVDFIASPGITPVP